MSKTVSGSMEMAVQTNAIDQGSLERRSESRILDDLYSSVEFSIRDLDCLYQFKIWETSDSGLSILVNHGSQILKHLETGNILDIKYYPGNIPGEPVVLKTEIKHITRDVNERIKGHCLIGLSIIDKETIH